MKSAYKLGSRLRSGAAVKERVLLVALVFVASIASVSFSIGAKRAGATVPGTNTLVSANTSGSVANASSAGSTLSANGKFVVFRSTATDIVTGDTNNKSDVFVRNIATASTTRVNISTLGVQADQAADGSVQISETGRYVVFRSKATNLIDGRTISSSYSQLYLRDTKLQTTALLSEVSSGVFADATVNPLGVSTDGRFVLVGSEATNLGPTVPSNNNTKIFMLDRAAGAYSLIDPNLYSAHNGYAQMSCDGSYVIFSGEDATTRFDVLLLDRRTGDRIVDITAVANNSASNPRISCDGKYVAFASKATNLDPGVSVSGSIYHAFSYDRASEAFSLIDQSSTGVAGNAGIINLHADQAHLSISNDGYAAFRSQSTNLTSHASSQPLIYLRDASVGTTELLTRDSGGTVADNASSFPSISLNGKLVAYDTLATNLVSSDLNAVSDVLVSDTGY